MYYIAFQRKIIQILKDTLLFELRKKSLTFLTAVLRSIKIERICLHKNDFQVEAEWQFFTREHDKSACDELGSTVKRLASKASLQKPYNDQIPTPKQLFEFANGNISDIDFENCTVDDYDAAEKKLLQRFNDSKTIEGTHKLHIFIPISENHLLTKLFSSNAQSVTETLTKVDYYRLPTGN